MSGCYDILYLHLGSNDVCCKDSNFYRCVTEILDVVFSVCTEIHVVLCVILPRDFDVRMFPRWPLSGAQLRNYCQWIRSANSMLWELSHHVPSVRYMDYAATKQKSLYLSHNGLHLSAEGARRCLASIHDDLPNQLCVEAAVQDPTEWPALSATEVPVQEHDSTIALFSDIVQTGAQPEIQDKVDASEVPVPRDIKPQTHKITVVTARAKRSATRNVKRYGKKLAKKCHTRSCCSGFVYLDITEDVAVFLPAYKLNGLCLEDEINVPSNIHCHRDTEETPQQDDNAANEDKVNVPSHFFFQRDTDETPQQDVDTSQLLLILSNDVELNPGPIFQTIPVPVEAVGSSEKMTIITVKMD
ncbi:uncharacterized protein LOC127840805 [Dreissena polymorpha]|uniref:uncharacterized protein LOC127840805 n=1 Tax=Dreissena polymorpha TaxID=45954 RepID=UPI0022643DDF|nr:uncharacterized protein LOC127840805 [Dreissena polymorpha]